MAEKKRAMGPRDVFLWTAMKLHAEDPYRGFDPSLFPSDASGWHSDEPVFLRLIDEVRPGLIIEVGSWKGASAIFMARHLKASGLECGLICVDTWLGSAPYWMDQGDAGFYGSLRLRHGYPSVYYQFLANVVRGGLQDIIVPFPQTSSAAARWFRRNGTMADLVYIDASHYEEDVLADLKNYWSLLSPRGVLFGDDYDIPGVKAAVDGFARENRLSVDVVRFKWILRKAGRPAAPSL